MSGIGKFFDLSVRDQIEASLMNGGGDCFFLFSGPPLFSSIGADLTGALEQTGTPGDPTKFLCPLLFTTNFSDPDMRPPDGVLASFGTMKTIAAPSMSNPAPRSIAIGSMALVTSKPGRGAIDRDERWNILKRMYWWAHESTEGEVQKLFQPNQGFIGDEREYPHAIAPEKKGVWGNFSRSSFYKMPLGILAVALSKSAVPISIRYYEGCILQQVGPQLQAALNQPIIVSGNSTNIQMTYADVKTFDSESAKGISGSNMGAEGLLLDAVQAVLKEGPTTTE